MPIRPLICGHRCILSSYHDMLFLKTFALQQRWDYRAKSGPCRKQNNAYKKRQNWVETIVISKFAKIGKQNESIKVLAVSKIEALISVLFG